MFLKNYQSDLIFGITFGFSFGLSCGLLALIGSFFRFPLDDSLANGDVGALIAGLGFGIALALRPERNQNLKKDLTSNLLTALSFALTLGLTFCPFALQLVIKALGFKGMKVALLSTFFATLSPLIFAIVSSVITTLIVSLLKLLTKILKTRIIY